MNEKAPAFLSFAVALALLLPAAKAAGDTVKIRVTADLVNVRRTAMISAPAVGRVEKGQVFTVVEKEGEWYLIQFEDGTPGYIHSFAVEVLPEGREAPAAKPVAESGGRKVLVTVDRANVRKAALLSAPRILTAEKGRIFTVVEKEGEWYLIQLEDGTPGYIHSFTVAEVAGAPAPPKPAEKPGEAAVSPVEKPQEKPPVPEKKTEDAAVQAAGALSPAPLLPTLKAGPRRRPGDSFSMVLARAGYFVSADSAYTDVYRNGLVYGGELRLGGKALAGWLEGTYRAETGELTYTKEKTEVSVLAAEAGFLCRFTAGDFDPYAGAGFGLFMFKEKSEAIGRAEQNKVGFCLVGGAAWSPGGGFVVDARLKYEFCPMKPADFDIEVGGLTAGLGIGFRW
jgi:uncharacterized protein YgiM (DUF1202 family)